MSLHRLFRLFRKKKHFLDLPLDQRAWIICFDQASRPERRHAIKR